MTQKQSAALLPVREILQAMYMAMSEKSFESCMAVSERSFESYMAVSKDRTYHLAWCFFRTQLTATPSSLGTVCRKFWRAAGWEHSQSDQIHKCYFR